MVAGGLSGGDSYGGYRTRLVETLQSKGIHDLGVLRAVSQVPRHLFVPESVRHRAYEDCGAADRRRPDDLAAVGAGALPRGAAAHRHGAGARGRAPGRATRRRCWRCWPTGCSASSGCLTLRREAQQVTRGAGHQERHDAWLATALWAGGPIAPYDAILVAAASPEVPAPLLEQLAVGGRLVIPIGDREKQVLHLVTRRDADQYDTTTLGDVRFVPLIGEHGFRT